MQLVEEGQLRGKLLIEFVLQVTAVKFFVFHHLLRRHNEPPPQLDFELHHPLPHGPLIPSISLCRQLSASKEISCSSTQTAAS